MTRFPLIILCTLIVLAACAAPPSTEEANRPTLPPSWTPPPLPTHPRLTETEGPPTEIPSVTPTFTPSATITPLPTRTPIPTATPEPTRGPSPTPRPTRAPSPEGLQIGFEPVASGLVHPTGAAAMPGTNSMVVIEQGGGARIVDRGRVLPTYFLEISGFVNSAEAEQGLIGIAFHPNFTSNGYVYVDYTDANGHVVIQRWTARSDRRTVDPTSGAVMLTIPHPGFQHNGGHIAFGPDGYLYIGVGDGGGKSGNLLGGSPGRVMLGAILRIDVNGSPYRIPPDNPFYGLGGWQPEVWDFGLRNPFQFSFDRQTGDLYIGDVGEDTWEEINFQPAGQPGQNFGWPVMEGSECYDHSPCDGSGLALPVAEHDHEHGCSVVGGSVYRGKAHPDLTGIYFYGDFCTGDIYGLANTGGAWVSTMLLGTDIGVTSFSEDADGEIYVTDYIKGRLLRLTGFRP